MMASSDESIYRSKGRGVLLTHNEDDFTQHSKPLVEPHDVHMEKVEEEVTYTTVCLDNALRLPFLDQAHKWLSTASIKSKDCPLSFSSLGVRCDKIEKLGRAVIRRASRIVEKSTKSSYNLRLSEEAIAEIRSIEKVAVKEKYNCPTNDIKSFLETFGSHYIQGSFETLSSFEWAVIAESNCDADILLGIADEVFQKCQQLLQDFEGSNSGIWYDINCFLDTSDWNRRKKKVLKLCKLRVMHNNQMEQNQTFQQWLQVTPQKRCQQIQCMQDKTESVKPVWNLIEESVLQFQRADRLAESFEATWKKIVNETKHVEKLVTQIPDKIESTSAVVDLETKWKKLQKDIGIEIFYPCKLSLQEVMALDCHLSKPSSWNEIAWDMLKRLIMIDNRVLEKPFNDYIDEMEHQGATKQKIIYPHPLDVMLLLFHASDFMLRQVLVKKLFMCRKAIPFIVPTEAEDVQVMLWPLRFIVMEWESGDKAMEESLITYPIPRTSFIKLGKSDFSKSSLINDILSENHHRVFLTGGVETERILSNGMVEMTHYSPTGKTDDIFVGPVLHFNLRGDACKFRKQADMLANLSHVFVVICDISEIFNTSVQDILISGRNCRTIVLLTNATNLEGDALDGLLDEADVVLEYLKQEQNTVIQVFNDEGKNTSHRQIIRDVRKAINKSLLNSQIASLENSVYQGMDKNSIDEISHKECIDGQNLANELIAELECVLKKQNKHTLLPLQGRFCKDMGLLLRKQYREKNQEYKDKVADQMHKLRRDQNEHFRKQNSFVKKYFMDTKVDPHTMLFFTKWVKIALDNECRIQIPQLQADYNLKWKNLMIAKKTTDPTKIEIAQFACNRAEEKVADASLGLEHLMREIGQIYEVCNDSQQQKELQQRACSLLMAGYPLEIMDGDNGFIPTQWVTEVLKEVSRIVGTNKKVFVLSVLGVQSSGKSTLLNAMFGLEFAVSAGRCTRGIYAQMLPVNKKRSPELPFDYLLVLDSEGLRAPELALQKFEHDNELATLVIGLADLTLINLKGENTAEIQDVLQIVVHAFLRMQEADSYTKRHCMFIHQNVSAVNAEAKMKHGQQKLQERLDEMTVQAAEALGLEKRFTSFHDVISFEGDKDISYFSDLWTGDPPMATVNTNYSEKCVLVRKQILDQIANNNSTCLTIADFTTRLQDLWKGVLADDFVFSFRSSLAAKAYISLEQRAAKHRRQIETTLLGWINKECHIKIGNCSTVQELHDCFQKVSRQLSILATENAEKETAHLKQFVENHPHKDILEQWKTDKLVSFKVAVESDISQLEQLLSEMKERKMVVLKQHDQLHNHESDIMRKAIVLAEDMKGENPSDAELRGTFENMWKIWSEDMSEEGRKGPPILNILHGILIEMFRCAGEYMYLSAEMDKHERNTSLIELILTQDDVEPKSKYFLRQIKNWLFNKGGMDVCNETVINIIRNQHIVDGIVSQGIKFNKLHGTEVLQPILDRFAEVHARKDAGAMFVFKPSVKARVCLIVCDYAAEQFEKMDEEFERLHGVTAKVEAYKKKVFIMFQDTVKQRLSETNAAEYLCEVIRPNIEDIVNKDMSRKVVDLILEDIGQVKFHLMLRIMQSVAESDDFNSIRSYITNAHKFASRWIQNHIESNLLFKSGKNKTKYLNIATLHVEKIITCLREGAMKPSGDNVTDLMGWINSFCKHAQQEVSIKQKELKHLENYKITNFCTFGQFLETSLTHLKEKINEKLAKVTKHTVIWNGPDPYTMATNKLWGCNEQCPFCREPCQRADADHKADHVCVQHRPTGINGVYYVGSFVLDTMTCNMRIAGNGKYNFRYVTDKTEDDYHPYKEYKKFYPQWDIAPDDAGDAAEYWKWIFCTFEKQIQDWHSHCKLEIPTSWHSVTKEQALNSLRVYKP